MSNRRRSPLSVLPTLLAFAATVVGVPVLLLGASSRRLGSASPLDGIDPPWRWTAASVRSWLRSAADSFDTSADAIDLLFRVGIVLAWLCVAVLVVTIVGEVIFQIRHGMPSTPRRQVFGLSRVARFIASGLVALLPIGAATPALAATPHAALAPATATLTISGPVSVDASSLAPPSHEVPEESTIDTPVDDASWTTYVVSAGESVWSIAERIAGEHDVAVVARRIVDANLGRSMIDGQVFSTPALIEPGWILQVPAGRLSVQALPPTRHAAETPSALAAPPADAHVVQPGDSYWRIAEEHLAGATAPPAPAAVHVETAALMHLNAPRLGHRDPALLLPGEVVMFATTPPTPPPPPTTAPPTTAPPAGQGTHLSVDEPPATTMPPPVGTSTAPAAQTAPAAPAAPVAAPVPPAPTAAVDTASSTASGRLPIEMGLGGAVLLSTGVLTLLESRRRRQLRAARLGERLASPTALERRAETQVRSMADAEIVARLDIALRAVAADAAPTGARVLLAIVDRGGELLIRFDRPCPTADPRWSQASAEEWVLAADVATTDLGDRARRSAQPCPAMVHLGRCDDGLLFVDLEALGLLTIDAAPEVSDAVARHVVASLAVSPFADSVRLITVGIEAAADLGTGAADPLDSLDAALDAAAVALGSTPAMTRVGGSTFAMRAAGSGEAWEPAVVVTSGASATTEVLADVVELCGAGGRGLAVLYAGDVAGAPWSLRDVGDGFVLSPLGLRVVPAGVSARDSSAVGALLARADAPLLPPPHPALTLVGTSSAAGAGGDMGAEWAADNAALDDWTLLVRMLGTTTVEGRDGAVVPFERSKALELVVWLGQHRERATRTLARTALWDLDVRDATFANVVSDARRALARTAPPPAGEEWIARTLSEQLPLHHAVITDVDLLTRRLHLARRSSGAAAMAVLRPGLELVTGMPFTGTSYLWPDAEGITSSLTLLVVTAATEMATLALDAGDIDEVFWATGQGLKALPGHEELIAIRMRAHAAQGDLSGVRNEWESYERVLHGELWSAAEPAPKLVALRRQLLLPPLAS